MDLDEPPQPTTLPFTGAASSKESSGSVKAPLTATLSTGFSDEVISHTNPLTVSADLTAHTTAASVSGKEEKKKSAAAEKPSTPDSTKGLYVISHVSVCHLTSVTCVCVSSQMCHMCICIISHVSHDVSVYL